MLRELNTNEMDIVSGGNDDEIIVEAQIQRREFDRDEFSFRHGGGGGISNDAMGLIAGILDAEFAGLLFTETAFSPPTTQSNDGQSIESIENDLAIIIETVTGSLVDFVEFDESTGQFIINAPAVG